MKPILFSTPMVQAILAGRKTMTRRIVKPQPINNTGIDGNFFEGNHKGYVKVDGHPAWRQQFAAEFCKYSVGEILWVREAWRIIGWNWDDGIMRIEFATGENGWFPMHSEDHEWMLDKVEKMVAKDYFMPESDDDEKPFIRTDKPLPWRPSIHMPKEACRLFLKITDIRVERLNEISGYDVLNEGIGKPLPAARSMMQASLDYQTAEPYLKKQFSELWNKINGRESWEANLWVWVISFEKTEKP